MISFVVVLAIIAIAWTLWYQRAPLWLWSILTAAIWLILVLAAPGLRISQTLILISLLLLFIPLQIRPLRRRLVSEKALFQFRRVMPPMSQTEQEALDAGTVWWDGELFSGRPNWHTLLAYPRPKLNAREQAFLDGPVEQLCTMLNDWEITHEHYDLPPAVWDFLRQQGFFGMIIPRRFGGLEFSALAHSSIVTKIASRSTTAAVTVMVPNSLGPAELLMRYGTDAQKDHYLPRLARGDEIPCFALTGPEAGSDAAAMPDSGVVCRASFDGKDNVLGLRLNWNKRYITLGPVATVLGLAFKLYDPDHLLGDEEERGITLALIPTDTPGITIGRRHLPLNIPFQNGPNQGKDVFIPLDWIIGGPQRIGEGWRMLMECLAAGRAISLPALSTGAGKLASRATGAYARIRRQFKSPIGHFEGVEEALARLAAFTYQMDAVRTTTATGIDLGEQPAVLSAIAKYNLTEMMRRVLNDAMDIQGGSAICMGPRNLLARAYQGIPISITVEGANILTRSLIIFGQGALRCHPYILAEIDAARDNDRVRSVQRFDRALFAHIGFTLSNVARSLFLGLSGARAVRAPVSGPSAGYFRQFTRMSAAFALVADLSMLTLGGELKRREKLSGRLADALSQLYIGSCCLKRFHDQGSPAEDLPLLQWSCEHALQNIQSSLLGVLRNHPLGWVGILLRVLTFPLGHSYRGPNDLLGQRAANLLLQPSAARERLTKGIYLPSDEGATLARIDDALHKVVAAEAAEHALRRALRANQLSDGPDLLTRAVHAGIISAAQAAAIPAADKARAQVLEVDDFDRTFGIAQDPLEYTSAPRPAHNVVP